MYRLNRLNSANHHLLSLFTAAAAAAAPYPKQVLRLNPHFAFNYSTYRRKVLPPELQSKNVAKLTCASAASSGICHVYLVGTLHISTKSSEEVRAVIKFLQPEVVFLELCSGRKDVLTFQGGKIKVPTMGEMVVMWTQNINLFSILLNWFSTKFASRGELLLGEEFRVANKEAIKYGGKVILGDRPIEITMGRAWAKLSLWDKTKLAYTLVFDIVTLPGREGIAKELKEMEEGLNPRQEKWFKNFPTLWEATTCERDRYMSAELLRVARKHNSVVAVVGNGHLAGIQKNWKQPVDMKELLTMPTGRNTITMGKILDSFGKTFARVASRVSPLFRSR